MDRPWLKSGPATVCGICQIVWGTIHFLTISYILIYCNALNLDVDIGFARYGHCYEWGYSFYVFFGLYYINDFVLMTVLCMILTGGGGILASKTKSTSSIALFLIFSMVNLLVCLVVIFQKSLMIRSFQDGRWLDLHELESKNKIVSESIESMFLSSAGLSFITSIVSIIICSMALLSNGHTKEKTDDNLEEVNDVQNKAIVYRDINDDHTMRKVMNRLWFKGIPAMSCGICQIVWGIIHFLIILAILIYCFVPSITVDWRETCELYQYNITPYKIPLFLLITMSCMILTGFCGIMAAKTKSITSIILFLILSIVNILFCSMVIIQKSFIIQNLNINLSKEVLSDDFGDPVNITNEKVILSIEIVFLACVVFSFFTSIASIISCSMVLCTCTCCNGRMSKTEDEIHAENDLEMVNEVQNKAENKAYVDDES